MQSEISCVKQKDIDHIALDSDNEKLMSLCESIMQYSEEERYKIGNLVFQELQEYKVTCEELSDDFESLSEGSREGLCELLLEMLEAYKELLGTGADADLALQEVQLRLSARHETLVGLLV